MSNVNIPTTALIPITKDQIDGQQANTVNARDLHAFLEIGKKFTDWVKDRIGQFGFAEGQDFVVVEDLSTPTSGSPKARAQKITEYHLTLDMAKELSMVERNDKGKEARLYFLACERQAKQTIDPMAYLNDPAAMRGLLLTYTTKVLDLEEEKKILLPKATALDLIATATASSMCITDAAKVLQVQPQVVLFPYLSGVAKWIYRRAGGKGWLGYQDKVQQGLVEHKVTEVTRGDGTKKITEHVLITPKGLAKLAQVFAQGATA